MIYVLKYFFQWSIQFIVIISRKLSGQLWFCQELTTKPNEWKEALDYYKVLIGVFKPKEEEIKMNASDNLVL